jgi:hypothetical protein
LAPTGPRTARPQDEALQETLKKAKKSGDKQAAEKVSEELKVLKPAEKAGAEKKRPSEEKKNTEK